MRMHPARARKRIKLESIPKMAARTHCKNVRETPDKPKPPNTPIGTKSWCRGEANGFGNHADVSTALVDVQKDDNNPKTTKNVGVTDRPVLPRPYRKEDSKGGMTVLEGSKVLARGTRSCT